MVRSYWRWKGLLAAKAQNNNHTTTTTSPQAFLFIDNNNNDKYNFCNILLIHITAIDMTRRGGGLYVPFTLLLGC